MSGSAEEYMQSVSSPVLKRSHRFSRMHTERIRALRRILTDTTIRKLNRNCDTVLSPEDIACISKLLPDITQAQKEASQIPNGTSPDSFGCLRVIASNIIASIFED